MDKYSIDRFFKGVCSKEEAYNFINWIESPQSKQQLADYFKENWKSEESNIIDERYDEIKVLARINHVIDETYPDLRIKKDRKQYFAVLKHAAVFLLVLGFGYLFHDRFYINKSDDISEDIVQTIQKSTSPGQKLKFKLPDKSMVILNADSRLDFMENDSIREVKLEGEAFFEIAEDKAKPFIVESGDTKTIAIGTKFNVHFRDDESIVSLIDGKVKIKSAENEIYLIPGEQALINNQTKLIEKNNWEYFVVFGWKEGVLNFKEETFMQIINRLEQWYGVQINLSERIINNKHYSGRFDNEPLENVLESLSFIYGFKYDIDGKKVQIETN